MKARVADHPADVARPFLVIGALFFLTGFLGYLSVHGLPL